MGFDASKHLVDKRLEDVTIKVGEDEIAIKIRKIPWSLQNSYVSLSLSFDSEGHSHFDADIYFRSCLKYIIAEAPWGQTDDKFLSQISPELGKALESLAPKAFGDNSNPRKKPEEIKKE